MQLFVAENLKLDGMLETELLTEEVPWSLVAQKVITTCRSLVVLMKLNLGKLL